MVVTAGALRPVVHLVPPHGGGVDRCVRDLVGQRPQDWIAHVSEDQCVLERPAQGQYQALSPDALTVLALYGQPGGLRAVHAHSTSVPVRRMADRLSRDAGVPVVLTLHDIWFADPDCAPEERLQRLDFVRSASARSAPSDYIVRHLRAAVDADLSCVLIPNGCDPPAAPAGLGLPPMSAAQAHACGEHGFPIAVIGALGDHKGLRALEALARALPDGQRIVILGYTERQLLPGWAVEGRAWVHGVFEPGQLPALVRRYQARLAFFPPGMPESFSYALSDAWTSGLPVLAPDHGAMAERIQQHGGGQTYPPDADLDRVARQIAGMLASLPQDQAPVSLRLALPTVAQMVASFEQLYDALPESASAAPDTSGTSFQRQARTHLDGRFFRLEVLNLQARLEASAQARDGLERQLADEQARHLHGLRELTAQRDAWQARHAALVQRLLRPLSVLPPTGREALLRLLRRWWR